jgi:chromosome segregation ATPase
MLLWLSFASCGGPLKHTAGSYDASKVNAQDREAVDSAQSAVADEARRKNDAKARVETEKDALRAAEGASKNAKHELEIAEKQLDVEEAKASADKAAAVSGAEAQITVKTRDLEIAKAEVELAEARVERAEADAAEAETAWVVALAKLELAKSKAMGQSGNDAKREAELNQQVVDAESAHTAAQQELTEAQESEREALGKVNEVKSE